MDSFPPDDDFTRVFGAEELKKYFDLTNDISKEIGEAFCRITQDWKLDQMNPPLVMAAFASATFQSFLYVLFFLERMSGNPRFETLDQFNDAIEKPGVFAGLVERISGLLARTLSYIDPSSSYAVQIMRKDKDQH